MKIETSMYVPGYIKLAAMGTNEFTCTDSEFIIYNDKGCSHVFSALYDSDVINSKFRPDYDYLVKVTYDKNESITVFSKNAHGDLDVLYESEAPNGTGTCVMYRRCGFNNLVCTINDGYSPARTLTAVGVSFQLGGEHDLHA